VSLRRKVVPGPCPAKRQMTDGICLGMLEVEGERKEETVMGAQR